MEWLILALVAVAIGCLVAREVTKKAAPKSGVNGSGVKPADGSKPDKV